MSWTTNQWSEWPGDRDELDSLIRATGFSVWGRTNGKPITNMSDNELEALAGQLYSYSRPVIEPAPKPPPEPVLEKPKPKRKRGRPRKTKE